MAWLSVGLSPSVSYSQKEAQEALAAFAFGEVELEWALKPAKIGWKTLKLIAQTPLAAPPDATTRYRWAYHTFDCVPGSPNGLTLHDVVVTAAVDSQVSGLAVLRIMAISQQLQAILGTIPVEQTFWGLQGLNLGVAPPAAANKLEWALWRVWTLLMGLDDVSRAVTHKTLHHKRPWFFPMLDEVTAAALGNDPWVTISNDLKSQTAKFDWLEEWFAGFAGPQGGVPLTRLRIHDILLWGGLDAARQNLFTKLGPAALLSAGRFFNGLSWT